MCMEFFSAKKTLERVQSRRKSRKIFKIYSIHKLKVNCARKKPVAEAITRS